MVHIFSFFTGKKKSKRSASWTDAPTSTTAQLVGATSGTSTPAQQSVKRQTSRYLSLRTRSPSKMIDSPENVLHRQSSIGSLRRKASRRSTVTTVLPRFGFEGEGEGNQSLGKEMGVAGSTLGLENLVGLPKLRDSEVDVIYAVELSVDEVKACWELFGKALRDTGCDTVGLMLPQHTDPDPSTVDQLLALFLLHHQPSLAPSFPSISAYAASQSPKPLYSDLLRNALTDRPHPHELCEILKFSLQHLTPSQTPLIDKEVYIKFVQAEHAATYPLDAYSASYLPQLGPGIGECLNSIFEVIADIAIKSEYNMMSGGKVCLLLGWWLCGHREVEGDWQKVYQGWQVAGQRLEHLFYAWIRSQSTKSKLPTRLMELVDDYPFGESTLSTDHLPLPPPSSFPRHTLHVHLECEAKISQISPRDILYSALRANSSSGPLLAKLQKIATEDENMNIDHIIQLESQAFLKRSSGPSPMVAPPALGSSPSSNRLTIPTSTSGRSIHSIAHSQQASLLESLNRMTLSASASGRSLESVAFPQLAPLLELSEELGNLASRHPASGTMARASSSNSTAPNADWDDFSKLGFGDAPETVTKLDLQLSPRDLPLPLSRSPSAIEPIAVEYPLPKLKAVLEERIDIDDVFLPFVEDSQLDKVNSSFNNILLVRLSTAAALELSEESPIEWLLLSVQYKAPTPLKPVTTLRSASPSKESTAPRKRSSLGGLTSSFRRSSSMALRPDELKKSTGSKKSGRGLESLEEGSQDVTSETPKILAVGEMGELLEPPAPAVRQDATGPSAANQVAQVGFKTDVAPNSNLADVAPAAESVPAENVTRNKDTTPSNGIDDAPVTNKESTVQGPGLTASPIDDTSKGAQAIKSPKESGSWDISDWHYIAEGGANLVFGYHGRSAQFRNKALRIPKLLATTEDHGHSLDISIIWRDELLPKLLPKNHLPDVQPVSLDGSWVASLVKHVQHIRPDFRAEVDLTAFTTSLTPIQATLMEDLRTSLSDVSHTVLAIEIKPKWGFLPSSKQIRPEEAAAIKSKHSRYELHQHMRGIETEYEPLDLYSGDLSRMTSAMEALWGMWSSSGGKGNNWRVFVDGQAIGVTEGYMIPGVGESDDEAAKTVPILSPVLWHSGVMQRLQELQSTLDGTDISHLAQRFSTECPQVELFDPTLLPQPSAEELRQFIDLYLTDPLACKSDKWSLRESLIAYALSATFKDCSVFITCPLVSTSDGWKLDEPQATVKVIDLDLKPLANMRKWYDLDEKIWRHWQNTKSVVPEVATQPGSQLATPAEIAQGMIPSGSTSSSIEALHMPTPDRQETDSMDVPVTTHSQPDNELATPAQITRGALPSRLTSSSTEALYMPTPDRQENDTMDTAGTTPSSKDLRDVSVHDTSSTRALHSKTPEDSQPSTPKAVPTSTAATPASMSLSDALFISPSAAANQAATPVSMSLSDALFISPSAALTNDEHATPASMSFSDALFISPSAAMQIANENGRRESTFGLEESPMEMLNSHGHDGGRDEGRDEEHENERAEEVTGGLNPGTPKRATRSPGPSPSPGLVAGASDATTDLDQGPTNDFTFPTKVENNELSAIEPETTVTNKNDITNSHIPSSALSPVTDTTSAEEVGSAEEILDQVDDPVNTIASLDEPSTPTPSAEDQQHFRSVIAGFTEDPVESRPEIVNQEVTESHTEVTTHSAAEPDPEITNDAPMTTPVVDAPQTLVSDSAIDQEAISHGPLESEPANDRPATPLADRQQHMRAVLAGVADEHASATNSTGMDATLVSTDSEEQNLTPPFVTPMTFTDDIEPTYPGGPQVDHDTPTIKTTSHESKANQDGNDLTQ